MPAKFPQRNYAPRAPKSDAPAALTAWEAQAAWYDQHQGDGGDDFYTTLILPAVLRVLDPAPKATVLDVCCGQGVLGRVLAARGVNTIGVDASPALITAARERAGKHERYEVGDARLLAEQFPPGSADHAALVMALQDLDPIQPVLTGVAALVRPGGRVAIALTHPCFRIPRRTSWGWDDEQGMQFRRVDAYTSPLSVPIKTHPGKPADASRTTSYHRPLSTYLNACGAAGLAVTACEELHSHRRGTRGARFSAEDRAAKEIPLFLVLGLIRC